VILWAQRWWIQILRTHILFLFRARVRVVLEEDKVSTLPVCEEINGLAICGRHLLTGLMIKCTLVDGGARKKLPARAVARVRSLRSMMWMILGRLVGFRFECQ
jgi:hypothetical protein